MKASHRIAGIIAVVVASVGVTALALLYDWFPALISERDGQIDDVYRALLAASIPFGIIILAFIAFCIIEFRAKPGDPDDLDGEPFHGSTRLEVIWTIVPTIIVVGLGIYAWMVLADIEEKQPNEMRINVVGQQFIWNYEYPEFEVKTSEELVVPVNKPLYFSMTAADVQHSFFIPNVRLKRDVADGFTTHIRFTPEKTGSYPIVCTELCGIGHATMRSTLRVVSQSEFDTWIKEQKSGGAGEGEKQDGGGGPDGKSIFTREGCGACHKLADAATTGQAGPELDTIGGKGKDYILSAIVDPNADVADGFQPGIMPDNYEEELPEPDIAALVDYLAQQGK